MPDTFVALAIALLAVLPGALYTFALERVIGSYGVTFAGRVIRLLAASAVLHAAAAGLTYAIYIDVVAPGRLGSGQVAPLHVEVLAVGYVALPMAFGAVVGHGRRRGWGLAVLVVGASVEPRAWDEVWSRRPEGYVRLRLHSGTWLGGYYGVRDDGVRSFAAGYPESGDLFLAQALVMEPETGEFLLDEDGRVIVKDHGLLVEWADVEWLALSEGARG